MPPPVDDDQADFYEVADRELTAAGLDWYELSNWSRPGHECRHNLAYWRGNSERLGWLPEEASAALGLRSD